MSSTVIVITGASSGIGAALRAIAGSYHDDVGAFDRSLVSQ
jgi:NADP-dependent 3-hydroxy acid dehydrogenase YdfG